MRRATILFLVIIAALSVGCRFGAPKPTYSGGYRVGVIEKFSEKGLIRKTHEGRMILEGYDRDDKGGLVVRKFWFSILPENASVVPQIEAAMMSGKRVRVHYREDLLSQIWFDASYFVDRVEVAQ
jgi:hypothetical protein